MPKSILVDVYYVGRKDIKSDNILNHHHRVWRGFGSVLKVPEDDAEIYFTYPEVWSRTAPKHKAPAPVKGAEVLDPLAKTEAQGSGDEDFDRETLIQAAILQLDPEDDFTETGLPKLAAIEAVLKTNVSAEEVDRAIKQLKAEGKL
jgi:hypothetical protein